MIIKVILLVFASSMIVFQNVTISTIEYYHEVDKWIVVMFFALLTALLQWKVFATAENNLTMFLLLSLVCTLVLSFINGVFILGEPYNFYNVTGLLFIILGGILLKM